MPEEVFTPLFGLDPRLANGKTLIVEIKGEDSEQNRAKRMALDAWVRVVNARGGFGL